MKQNEAAIKKNPNNLENTKRLAVEWFIVHSMNTLLRFWFIDNNGALNIVSPLCWWPWTKMAKQILNAKWRTFLV